jgi:hypothetical protein
MHGVGFEPTSIATPHLECGPLDRSGIRASPMYSHSFLSNNTNYILYSSEPLFSLPTSSQISIGYRQIIESRGQPTTKGTFWTDLQSAKGNFR